MAKKSKKQKNHEVKPSNDLASQNVDELVNDELDGILLSTHERDVCIQISEWDAIHTQRAQALLAIDEGATQAQAGERGGLTKGQVRYWLGKYREMRLDIFPDSILKEEGAELANLQAEAPEEDRVETESPVKVETSKGKKSKKKKGKRTTRKKKKPENNKGKGKKNKKKSK